MSVNKSSSLSTGDAPASLAANGQSIAPEVGSAHAYAVQPRPCQHSAAAAVVAQARENSRAQRKVTDMREARVRQTALHVDVAARSIRIEFPNPGSSPFVVDLSFLTAVPNLALPLAEGFRLYGMRSSQKTLQGRRCELRIGLVAFLRDKGLLGIRLAEIDRHVWAAYEQWLDAQIDGKTGSAIHPKTRATRFGAVVAVIKALKASSKFGADARIVFDARQSSTWSYVATRTRPRDRLPFETLQAIDAAVADGIQKLSARAERDDELLRAGRRHLSERGYDLSDFGTCAAYVEDNYSTGIPNFSALRKDDPDLFRALRSTPYRRGHGMLALKAALYPSAADMVPLVLRLAIESALNPTTLFELEWGDVAYGELLSEPVVRIFGRKRRASQDPLVPISAARIVPALELARRLTKRVRATVAATLRNRVFIFFRSNSATGIGFGCNERAEPASPSVWVTALRQFCDDHGIPVFTLSQIRATLGDEIALREGIVVASQVLNHRSLGTTDAHYVSDGTRWREAEELGRAMLLRERWFQSNGKIDPRRRVLAPSIDRGAATPGFYCFDPYDSPLLTQHKGRLCVAYGMCPSCPLAAANVMDPASVALYAGLRDAIFLSQGHIAGEAWLARYGQVAADLDALLHLVPDDVMESARRFRVQMPRVE